MLIYQIETFDFNILLTLPLIAINSIEIMILKITDNIIALSSLFI